MSKCPECLGPSEENSLCDQCLDKIDEEQNRFDSEHEANETFQYRSQLI